MKKYFFAIFISLLLMGCTANETVNELKWPEEEFNIVVSSDLHWQTQESKHRTEYLDEITATLFYETINSNTEALILNGDLANSGRLQEHLEIADMLKEVEANGVDVFVTMGNHDVDGGVEPSELKEIYKDFGFEEAISNDEYSMSYLAKLNEEVWLMSLDFNLYHDRESSMAAMFTDKTFNWIEESLKKASEAGVMVIPFGHHNLIENSMEGFNHHYNIENGEKISELFLKYGVPIYLSGHKHNSFVDTVEKHDNKLYEIVIDAPINYPNRYTTLTFKNNNEIDYKLNTLDIEAWAKNTDNTDENVLNYVEYSEDVLEEYIRGNAENIVEDLTDDEEEKEKMKDYYIEVFTTFKDKAIWENKERLKEDSALIIWEKYREQNIFGKWLPWILNSGTDDKPEQILYFEK